MFCDFHSEDEPCFKGLRLKIFHSAIVILLFFNRLSMEMVPTLYEVKI